MSKLWSPLIRDIEPYVPGEQPKGGAIIKLNTNENPYPPSPAVAAALDACSLESLRLYPDPEASALKAAIALNHGVQVEQVFVGNGSDEVLGLAFMAFFKQVWPILFPDYTYSFYPVYCSLFDIEYRNLPLTAEFRVDVEDYAQANGGIVLANPNAPTGVALPLSDVETLVRNSPDSVVIIDEAYVDFGAESAASLVDQYPNLLVVQTFSKSRSLAGLRIGYALGNQELIEGLERVKNSFNSYPLDRLAIAAGVASMQDTEYFEQTCQSIIASRDSLTRGLLELDFDVLPSATNFVFAKPVQPAAEVYQKLREQGILVRYFAKPGISDYLRITVGTDAECDALLAALKTIA